ncbi:hypothetical protein N4G58_18485 [Edwardsiella piscicida]|nr:hypothetical protein N4G58_18485 [Edwardsiella piscicida]
MLNIHSASLAPTDRQTIVPHAAPGPENGASVIAQAMVELSESQSDALEETQEDLSFALGDACASCATAKSMTQAAVIGCSCTSWWRRWP